MCFLLLTMAIRVVEFSNGVYEIKKIFAWEWTNPKDFSLILRIGQTGSLSSLQKSESLMLTFSFFHYFWCQNWDQWHKKTHIYVYIFSTFGSKINEFEQKNWKKTKKFQNPKSCRQLPSHLIHTSYSIFYVKNQNNQL